MNSCILLQYKAYLYLTSTFFFTFFDYLFRSLTFSYLALVKAHLLEGLTRSSSVSPHSNWAFTLKSICLGVLSFLSCKCSKTQKPILNFQLKFPYIYLHIKSKNMAPLWCPWITLLNPPLCLFCTIRKRYSPKNAN